MPTYEYVCRGCGHEFERFQSITASAVRTCPRCGARKVERRIGMGGAVIFKGGGFYETDYRSESYRKGEESERGAKAAATTSGSSTTDAAKTSTPTSESSTTPAPEQGGSERGSAATNKSGVDPATPAKDTAKTKMTPPRAQRGKSHAREGRGIGNVLQLGRDGPKREGRSPKRTQKKGKK